MIVDVPSGAGPQLLERDDFKALKVTAPAGTALDEVAGALDARTAEDDHLWIPAAVFKRLAEGADAEWHASFDAMCEKVAPYGWYDADAQAVKAHVEFG